MNMLHFLVAFLFLGFVGLTICFLALARQVGVLFERVSPAGALVTQAGPTLGSQSQLLSLPSLTGQQVLIGHPASRAMLVFFLSPTCPICKKMLPVLKSVGASEASWLEIVLASDGDAAEHQAFIDQAALRSFPYVLSTQLGLTYRVERLPFAVLIDNDGIIRAKGLVNNREQLESLFNSYDTGARSIQEFLSPPSERMRTSQEYSS